jgi:hypothetical protein
MTRIHRTLDILWDLVVLHNHKHCNTTASQTRHFRLVLVFVGSDFSRQLYEKDAFYAFNLEFVKGLNFDRTQVEFLRKRRGGKIVMERQVLCQPAFAACRNPTQEPQSNSQLVLSKRADSSNSKCQNLPIKVETKSRRTEDSDQEDVYLWTLTGDREGEDTRKHPNVSEDDFEDIRGWHSPMWLVPAYKNSSSGLVGLLVQTMVINSAEWG